MNTIERVTDALRRRDAELIVHDDLDSILRADHAVPVSSRSASPRSDSPERRRLLRASAAVAAVFVGLVGVAWAANGARSPRSAPTPTLPQPAVPAGFPRLTLPDPLSGSDRRLVGAQDYAIEGGWFSFQNYDQELDLNNDGTLARRGTFSMAIFTGTQVDAERAGCGSTPEVFEHGARTISIYERTQNQRRFVWNEAPGVYVVVETNFIDRGQGLAAIASLEPIAEDAWQQRLGELPSDEIVADADVADAIWSSYTTDEPLGPPRTVPGASSPVPTAVSALC